MVVRITTWNVNGIRNPFGYQPWRDQRTFDGMFDILEADIVIMQELKIQRKDLRDDMVLVPGWDCYFSLPRHKKGYSGVGIYTRNSVCAPIRAEEGLLGVLCPPGSSTAYRDLPFDQKIGGYPSEEEMSGFEIDPAALDAEGRCVLLEFPAFVLFGIYSPANSSGLRDDFRFAFINALDTRVRNLITSGKSVVVTGDLNVSRGEIDTAAAEETLRKEGITHEEYISTPNRRIFNQLLEEGEVFGERDVGREKPVLWDICRGFHPTRKAMYTHWEQKKNARPGNFGSRIDFILCSLDMKSWFCEANIQEGLMGSDHCPVYAVMKDVVERAGNDAHLKDMINPLGTFKDGNRLRDYSLKDMCALSAKNMQHFANRRSIRDMFGKPEPAINVSTHGTPSMAPPNESPNGTETPNVPAEDSPRKTPNYAIKLTPSKTPLPDVSFNAGLKDSRTSEVKRKAAGESKVPNMKRSKSSSLSATGNASDKGQQSLKNFFASRGPNANAKSPHELSNSMEEAEPSKVENESAQESPSKSTVPISDITGIAESLAEDFPTEAAASSEPATEDPPSPPILVDPIVSKESWGKLFSKKTAPRCEGHSEPCQLLKTKKPGFNCGREFWMCARPLGPTGQKERNTQWRCPTFIWSSDWNSNPENAS